MIRRLFILSTFLLLSGCNVFPKFYILSTASTPVDYYKINNKIIGVEKVVIPKYLFKKEIAIAKSSSEVIFLENASWAEELDEGLTNRFINFLQKKFNEPKVFTYPWGVTTQPDIVIKIKITHFMAQNNRVLLEGNFTIENLKTQKSKSKLFLIKVKTTDEASDIVASMDKALITLEEKIADAIQLQ